MVNYDMMGARTLLQMLLVVGISALAATFLIVGIMIGVQDVGTPLIGSDQWFLFYMIPVIFLTLLTTVFVYRKFAQEKITFNY